MPITKDRKRSGYSGFAHRVLVRMARELRLPRCAFQRDDYYGYRARYMADLMWKRK